VARQIDGHVLALVKAAGRLAGFDRERDGLKMLDVLDGMQRDLWRAQWAIRDGLSEEDGNARERQQLEHVRDAFRQLADEDRRQGHVENAAVLGAYAADCDRKLRGVQGSVIPFKPYLERRRNELQH
jgi:hypothetical protein